MSKDIKIAINKPPEWMESGYCPKCHSPNSKRISIYSKSGKSFQCNECNQIWTEF